MCLGVIMSQASDRAGRPIVLGGFVMDIARATIGKRRLPEIHVARLMSPDVSLQGASICNILRRKNDEGASQDGTREHKHKGWMVSVLAMIF